MRTLARGGSLLAVALLGSGCYHATVDTGRTPSGQTIEKPWAHSFIAGLVPPSTVETAQKCPDGVAKVETQQSFLNLVANVVTFGIYSPMTITVQCAAAGTALAAPVAEPTEAGKALDWAARESVRTGEPVYLRF
jgi:hypothetical protein